MGSGQRGSVRVPPRRSEGPGERRHPAATGYPTARGWASRSAVEPVRDAGSSLDAAVVVPGIMGSELVERESHKVLWGMGVALASAGRLGYRARFAALEVTDDERSGKTGRVVPTRLLATPDWLPGLGGVEPYGRLVQAVRTAVVHRDAVLEFAYDWRLDVQHNAGLLARAARLHLASW